MQSVCKREDLDRILQEVSPVSILDIGCSTNALSAATHLVDYIDNSLLYPDKKFIVQDLNGNPILPFDDGSIDFVYCSHVLEHLDNPESLLREIIRIGKGGMIIVPTKLEDNLYSFDAVKIGETYLTDRYGHKWWFDYGRDSILEICDRKRVLRRLPQSEIEISSLRKYMPNAFELSIYWSDQISWQFVHHSSPDSPSQVRVGISDLGIFLRALIRRFDARNDRKTKSLETYLRRKSTR